MHEHVLRKSPLWPKAKMHKYKRRQRQLEKGLQHCDTHVDKLRRKRKIQILATELCKSFANAAAFQMSDEPEIRFRIFANQQF